jgi:hypothetical protein
MSRYVADGSRGQRRGFWSFAGRLIAVEQMVNVGIASRLVASVEKEFFHPPQPRTVNPSL